MQNKITPEIANILKKHQYADQILYNYFEDKHQNMSHKFGLERLQSYTQQLNELNKYVVKKCDIKEETDGRVFLASSG